MIHTLKTLQELLLYSWNLSNVDLSFPQFHIDIQQLHIIRFGYYNMVDSAYKMKKNFLR